MTWQAYEQEKKKLPPMTPKEYEAKIREIAKRLKVNQSNKNCLLTNYQGFK